MKHTYRNIFGMFDYQDLYSNMVKKSPSSATFVEIGSFHGKSAAYMGCEIINSKKNIQLYCVDPWEFEDLDLREDALLANFMRGRLSGDHAFKTFKKSILPYESNIKYLKMKSSQASHKFDDRSLDFVFIDGEHSYLGCYIDIVCWFKKIKPGGTIAGHDYLDDDMPGVTQAVTELLPNAVPASRRCWIYQRH
ncbi:hypothetical protein CL622_03680 [archaeon]|nr:hypothetical protein [archaeon]|tara:strand:- start:1183 stop:1761 length:579 start_codon:yes stop_codon:yes gene_type:complete